MNLKVEYLIKVSEVCYNRASDRLLRFRTKNDMRYVPRKFKITHQVRPYPREIDRYRRQLSKAQPVNLMHHLTQSNTLLQDMNLRPEHELFKINEWMVCWCCIIILWSDKIGKHFLFRAWWFFRFSIFIFNWADGLCNLLFVIYA